MPMLPKVTVIISAYQRYEHLEKCLLGFSVQSDQDFQIIVADDGSGPKVAEVIDDFKKYSSIPIRHVWQPDEGFQKSKILNKAVHVTSDDLLIFVDQDVVPTKGVVHMHRNNFEKNVFLRCAYLFLRRRAQPINKEDILSGSFVEKLNTRVFRRAFAHRVKTLKFFLGLRAGIVGLHFSVCRNLFLKVNGFDLSYTGWGYEDTDLGLRLQRAGGAFRSLINHQELVVHLWHPKDPTRPLYKRNRRRLEMLYRELLPIRCENGLDQCRDAQ